MKSFPLRIRFPRFPIAVEFTREGIIFVLLTLAIGAAAVNTGNNVLYLIFSTLLGLIVVSGIISRRILKGVHATVSFPEQLFCSVPNVCYISVENKKERIPSIGLRFLIRNPEFGGISRHFFFVPSQEQRSGFAPVTFRRRGLFHLKETEIQTKFPFSFFVKIKRFFVDQTIRVYPTVYRLSEDLVENLALGIVIESPYRGDSQQLLHLRDYAPLDSSKLIHWKASAKAEKLLVKEFQKEQGRDLYFYFDCFLDPQEKAVFEKAVSLTASLAYLFKERGIRSSFVFPDATFRLLPDGSMTPLLDYLAQLQSEKLEWTNPDDPSSIDVALFSLRSRKGSSILTKKWPGLRTLWIEDWLHVMNKPETFS